MLFDQRNSLTLQADASEYGLCVLMQEDSSRKLQLVAYMSCQLKPNEVQWAQIEKEALAFCAACSKLDLWLYGKAVTVHLEHEALETIFKNSKLLAKAPKCLQRIMFRLQRCAIHHLYRKGSFLVVADTVADHFETHLLQAPISEQTQIDSAESKRDKKKAQWQACQ